LQAEILYPPPRSVLDFPLSGKLEQDADWQAMQQLAATHDARYGKQFKALTRARNAWSYAQEFRQRGVKHIHIHFANRATHTALFLKQAGFTFSFTAHAQDFMVDLGSRELLQEMAQAAEFVVAVSEYSRGLLQEMCPDAAGKIRRIYNGLDPAAFQVSEAQKPGEPCRILSIGRLIDFKGFQVLIPAVAGLRRAGRAVELNIVGEGPLRPVLERLIAESNAGEFIRLLGVQSQDQIKAHLAESDIFALACVVDAKGASDILPTVITEAMASGLPVVSTRLVGVPEMVDHEITGLLAAPEDVTDLAAQLDRLIENPALRKTYGQAGRHKFESTFALEHTAGQLAEMLRPYGENVSSDRAQPAPRWLCLLTQWPGVNPELDYLSQHPAIHLAAARADLPAERYPQGCQFLPDAMVLEAAWRNAPAWVARLESLYEKCGPVDGELYFREARRAVYLAGEVVRMGIRHLHAFRSDALLCIWQMHQLTGLPASATIEPKPAFSRSALDVMLRDFTFGSNAEPKLAVTWPDHFQLNQPEPKSGWFSRKDSVNESKPEILWQKWLERA
jgi:glycosyltransferase involved in cell wall biosynthesis